MQITLLNKGVSKADLAFDESIPTLGDVAQAYGHDVAQIWLSIQIHDLIDYIEQQQGVPDVKIEELCAIIIAQYYYLNLSEIQLFLIEVKSAHYGRFYGVTGPMQIIEMLGNYCLERSDSMYRKEEERLKQIKAAQGTLINQYTDYLKTLENLAAQGDKYAIETLSLHKRNSL